MKWNEKRRTLLGVTATTALFAGCACNQAWASQSHKLKHGETIDSLARRYHVSVGDIVSANHLSNKDNVPDGISLTIPDPPKPTIAAATMHRAGKLRSDRTSVRIGPGAEHRRVELYDAGTTLVVTAERDGWAQVSMPDGKSGWVRQDFIAFPNSGKNNQASVPRKKETPSRPHEPLVATSEDRRRHTDLKKAGAARRITKKQHEEVHPKRQVAFKKGRNHEEKVVSARWKKAHSEDVARSFKRHHQERASVKTRRQHVEKIARSHSHHAAEVVSRHAGRSSRRFIAEAERPEPSTDIVRTAYAYRGTPYRYGSAHPGGFDCSGFTSYLYSKKGVALPHSAREQAQRGQKVDSSRMKPGDLVFFHTVTSGISHVGMYVGEGKFVHSSSRRSGGVRVDSLNSGYYKKAFRGARRVGKNEEAKSKPEKHSDPQEEKPVEGKSDEKDD